MSLIVSEIWIYPVKSTMGRKVESAVLEPRGLASDRRWMLVDQHGTMITQRECAALQQIHSWSEGEQVWATRAGTAPLRLTATDARQTVTVWREPVSARIGDAAAQAWFSEQLGQAVVPVMIDESSHRPVDQHYAQAGDEVSFADGFPLLLIGEGSLQELNRRLAEPVDMRRFRPNLVIRGAPAFAEDTWRRIRINDIELELVKPCSRCVLTTRDPDTGVLNEQREPLRTLSSFRRQTGGIMFGQNVIARGTGTLERNAAVTVIDYA
jgi:hypothetical protein